MGVQQTFGGISRVAFPVAAGYMMDRFGYGTPFLVAALLVLVTLPLTRAMAGYATVGERDIAAMKGIVAQWLADGTWLTLRAVAAGLAHPPILEDPDVALYAVETAATLVAALTRAGAKDRREESFKILRQGLGYSLSVFAAASPGEGFTLLRKCAAVGDPDLAWVIRENLKKKRISDAFPEDAQRSPLLQQGQPHADDPFQCRDDVRRRAAIAFAPSVVQKSSWVLPLRYSGTFAGMAR